MIIILLLIEILLLELRSYIMINIIEIVCDRTVTHKIINIKEYK